MKSAREIAKEISNKAREFNSFNDVEEFVYDAIQSERNAYNALLDKVQLIEVERDELKKRVDSEYDRGIEDSRKVAEEFGTCDDSRCDVSKYLAEAILKLRRVKP